MPTVGWPDVCSDGTQVIGDFNVAQVWFDASAVPSTNRAWFLRAVSSGGAQVAIYKGAESDVGYVINDSGTEVALGATFGNQCVGIRVVSAGVVEAVWVESQTVYKSRKFTTALVPTEATQSHDVPAALIGHMATGFLNLTSAGVPLWTDAYRAQTVQGVPLLYPNQAGSWVIGQLGGGFEDQIVVVNGQTGQRGTLYSGLGFEPHIVRSDAGTSYYAAWRTLGTIGATFATIPPVPTFTSTEGAPLENATDARLYPPIQHPVTGQNVLMTKPWVMWAQRVVESLAAPVDLTSNVVGVLPPSNGGVNQTPLTGDRSFGVIASPTQTDVVATIPTDTLNLTSDDGTVAVTLTPATKTVDLSVQGGFCYIPMTTGAIPGEILFVGSEVMLTKVPVV